MAHNAELLGLSLKIDNPVFNDFLQCMNNVSKEECLRVYDASNACSFLSADICEELFVAEKRLDLEEMVTKVQNIILTKPKGYNQVRDIGQYYTLTDALKCMISPLHFNGCRQFWSLQSDQLCEKISSFVHDTVSAFKNVGFVYVCDIYIFSFGVNDGKLYFVDTHKVTPENGMICCFQSDDMKLACDELALLIEKRLLFSLSDRIYKLSHEINVVSGSPLDKKVASNLGITNVNDLLEPDQEPEIEYPPVETIDQDDYVNIEQFVDVQMEIPPDLEISNGHQTQQIDDSLNLTFSDFQQGVSSTPKSKVNLQKYNVIRPHQEEIINKVINEKQDCLLVWATGSGKTYTILNIIQRTEETVVLLVPTLALLIDMCHQLDLTNVTYGALSSLHCHTSMDYLKQSLLSAKPKV